MCLVEAGPPDDHFLCHVPMGAVAFVPTRWRNWAFQTEPQAALGGRRGYQPRGKMIGGSSGINAMIYMRGHPSDYDDWAAGGCRGWSWADVLPYFKRAEANERLRDAWHGTDGPLNVADLRSPNPFAEKFLAACEAAGLKRNPDFNGAQQEGAGWYQVTQKEGERWSAARASGSPPSRRCATARTPPCAVPSRTPMRRAAGRGRTPPPWWSSPVRRRGRDRRRRR